MSRRRSLSSAMATSSDRDAAMGPPLSPPSISTPAGAGAPGSPSSSVSHSHPPQPKDNQDVIDKYRKLKRRFFELEEKETALEPKRSDERNVRMREERNALLERIQDFEQTHFVNGVPPSTNSSPPSTRSAHASESHPSYQQSVSTGYSPSPIDDRARASYGTSQRHPDTVSHHNGGEADEPMADPHFSPPNRPAEVDSESHTAPQPGDNVRRTTRRNSGQTREPSGSGTSEWQGAHVGESAGAGFNSTPRLRLRSPTGNRASLDDLHEQASISGSQSSSHPFPHSYTRENQEWEEYREARLQQSSVRSPSPGRALHRGNPQHDSALPHHKLPEGPFSSPSSTNAVDGYRGYSSPSRSTQVNGHSSDEPRPASANRGDQSGERSLGTGPQIESGSAPPLASSAPSRPDYTSVATHGPAGYAEPEASMSHAPMHPNDTQADNADASISSPASNENEEDDEYMPQPKKLAGRPRGRGRGRRGRGRGRPKTKGRDESDPDPDAGDSPADIQTEAPVNPASSTATATEQVASSSSAAPGSSATIIDVMEVISRVSSTTASASDSLAAQMQIDPALMQTSGLKNVVGMQNSDKDKQRTDDGAAKASGPSSGPSQTPQVHINTSTALQPAASTSTSAISPNNTPSTTTPTSINPYSLLYGANAVATPLTPTFPPFPYYPYHPMAVPPGMYAPPPNFAPPASQQRPTADASRQAKPKRLKAHTVTTKSFSIPMVPRDKNRKPMLPLNVGIMTVISLGEVCMREHFHTERYIFPVGYEVTRRYLSTQDPNIEVVYHCTILDGGDGPKFQIVPSDTPDRPIIAGTATGAWSGIVKRANAIRNRQHSNSVSGPDFFGLGQNTIKHLIQELPNANRLRDYVWQNYIEGGPLGGRHAAVIPALPEEYDATIPIGAYYPSEREKQQRLRQVGQGQDATPRAHYQPHLLQPSSTPPGSNGQPGPSSASASTGNGIGGASPSPVPSASSQGKRKASEPPAEAQPTHSRNTRANARQQQQHQQPDQPTQPPQQQLQSAQQPPSPYLPAAASPGSTPALPATFASILNAYPVPQSGATAISGNPPGMP